MEARVKASVKKSGNNMAENSKRNPDVDRISSLKVKYNPVNLENGKEKLLDSMPVTKNQWMKSTKSDEVDD